MSFVQANSAQPASPATTATVNYTLAQTAGNLNVVIIGWADTTATIQSVVDSAGNTYTLAFPATHGHGTEPGDLLCQEHRCRRCRQQHGHGYVQRGRCPPMCAFSNTADLTR